jgi:hypothetical protein
MTVPAAATSADPVVLDVSEWAARQAAHQERVRPWVAPHLERRRSSVKHPVEDFLFDYYAYRPAELARWNPGLGIALSGEGSEAWLHHRGYVRAQVAGQACVTVDPALILERRRESVVWMRSLLRATLERVEFFGCHGLHEWAMVYGLRQEEVRHNTWPLRMEPAELKRFIDSRVVRCSHFDAFRFFTDEARPLNRLQPERARAVEFEQGGCLHANMDLYKWSFKLAPLVPSELVADCFEFAREIRLLDMQASPYDLRALGLMPVAIETELGRSEYEARQRAFSVRGRALRERLLQWVEAVLSATASE